jgi:glycosyltransferase involved in cell wall biosynthesis
MISVCLAPAEGWSVEPSRTFCREIRTRLASRVEFVGSARGADLIVSVSGALPEDAVDADVAHVLDLPRGRSAAGKTAQAEAVWLRRIAHAVVTSYAATACSTWVRKTLEREARIRPTLIPWGVHERVVGIGARGNAVIIDGDFDPRDVQAIADRALSRVVWLREAPVEDAVGVDGVKVVVFPKSQRWADERWAKVLAASRLYVCRSSDFDPWAVDMKAAGSIVVAVGRGGHTPDVADAVIDDLSHLDVASVSRRGVTIPTWDEVAEEVYGVWLRAYEAKQPHSPRVTVVIPALNPKPEWLARSLGSALRQTYQDLSIVVVDDGSDPPIDLSHLDGEDRAHVTLIRHDATKGVAVSRNEGIRATRSEYVCCLDHDDEIDPTFVEACVRFLDASSRRVGVAYTGMLIKWPDRVERPSWPPEVATADAQRLRNQVPTCNVFRRVAWERAGGYKQRYAPQGAGADDAALWLDMMLCGFVAQRATSEPLFTWYGGIGTSSRPTYREPNWRAGHVCDSGRTPFVVVGRDSVEVVSYTPPDVTVVIPVGPKHTELVVDAIDSVAAQSYPRWELIVVNDSGASLDVPPFVRVIGVDVRHPGRARNATLDVIDTPYVLFLDADDVLLSAGLEVLMKHAREDAWCYPDAQLEDGRVLRMPDWDVDVLYERGVAAVTALYPVRILREVGGFAVEGGYEDWDLHMRLATAGYCGVHVAQPLFVYRQETGCMRTSSQRMGAALDVRKRFSLEAMRMACRPCAQKRNSVAPPSNWVSKAEHPDFVAVEYTGTNPTDLIFRGATGRAYVFGANAAHRKGFVHKDDLNRLLSTHLFRVVEG